MTRIVVAPALNPTTPTPAAAPAVTSAVELVTPALAEKWLANMAQNRNLSENAVLAYAEDMEAGRWEVTNQGIGFDSAGKLIDGQHRLKAVILAGVDVRMLVTRGLAPDAMERVDTGRKRSVSDMLGLAGYTNTAKLVAAINIIRMAYANRATTTTRGRVDEVLLLKPYSEQLQWVTSQTTVKGLSVGPLMAALVMAMPLGEAKVKEAQDKLWSGVGLEAENPMLTLRNFLLANAGSKTRATNLVVFRKSLRAIEAYVAGEKMQKLQDAPQAVERILKLPAHKALRDMLVK